MQFRELEYKNKDEWHELRRKGIGGSDCSIIMGENPYNNDIVKLWKVKTGREEQEDISNRPSVIRGIKEEPNLRNIFEAQYPGYKVSVLEKTLVSLKYPFMSANLDGVLENSSGEKGVLEIKTTTCNRSEDYYDIWLTKDENGRYTENNIPLHYWLQIQHYLAVTGWEYAVLFADITLAWIKNRSILQMYQCARNNEAIKQIVEKEMEFYSYILNDVEPNYKKKLII